jgi:hypothetical protein
MLKFTSQGHAHQFCTETWLFTLDIESSYYCYYLKLSVLTVSNEYFIKLIFIFTRFGGK